MFVFIIPLATIGFITYLIIAGKILVDVPSFFKPTIPLDTGKFGVYCFTGKQGTGKTYSLTKYVIKNQNGRKLYSNLTLKGVKYTKIKTIDDLLLLSDEENRLIVFDEIFTILGDKTIPLNVRSRVLNFLSQQRKVHNIMITTAQEWLELPVTFRRYVRVQVDCQTRPWGRFGGLLIEEYSDATMMKWSNLENEYVSPRINRKYSKYEKKIMHSYDTYERIKA